MIYTVTVHRCAGLPAKRPLFSTSLRFLPSLVTDFSTTPQPHECLSSFQHLKDCFLIMLVPDVIHDLSCVLYPAAAFATLAHGYRLE